jgi:hypothetical protein
MRILAPAIVALTLAAAYPLATVAQPTPAPAAQPAPAPTPPAAPTTPSAAPLASPAANPSASPAPSPTASGTPNPYRFIVTPPAPKPGQPAILEIDLLDSTLHAGQPYSVRVKTSLDVTAINVSAMGSTYGMQMGYPGLFASDGSVPSGIPFFLLNRDYTLTVAAMTADGRTTTVPVTLRLER